MARHRLAIIKVIVCICCLAPLAWVVWRGFGLGSTTLGANPIEEVLHTMGKTGLNLLFVTLAITPMRRLTRLNMLIRLRRMLGLFCFFYLMLHLLTYAILDLRLDWSTLLVDVTERPYITVGMLALLTMIPLAITSTNAMQRRLGRNWARLHRLIYPIAILGVVHFYWQTKADFSEALLYALVLAIVLGFRVVYSAKRRLHQRRSID